jgi:serine/threonine protein phosphatase 1
LSIIAKPGNRLLVISDIHGFADELHFLLERAHYDPVRDQLILLGDYVDADNPATWSALSAIEALTRNGAIALIGNHELKLLASRSGKKIKQASWIRQLPLYHVTDNLLFVHAGIRPGVALTAQSVRDLTEIREEFIAAPWSAMQPANAGTIIFGHTPTYKLGSPLGEIWTSGHKIGIDTGAKHGGRLTLLDLTNQLAYSCRANSSGHHPLTVRKLRLPCTAPL